MLTSAFYFIAFVTIFFAIMVVASRNPIHSVLYLVLTFFSISANYIFMLDATFVGMVNIIVYAGAIMVLFLYVLMMMNLNTIAEQKRSALFKISAAVAGGMLLVVLVAALKEASFEIQGQALATADRIGSIKVLGFVLYSKYQLPFEIASILFLIAMIGAVVLGKKDTGSKTIGLEPVK
ncbi:MAG TPA: NADH-quinone oxidoreductase subunit J [Chitinophagales bacterium]|nr:NADH-quinone oxidoreductase subunit J [Chitinophagales bacterium]